jgi:hypothetical protein
MTQPMRQTVLSRAPIQPWLAGVLLGVALVSSAGMARTAANLEGLPRTEQAASLPLFFEAGMAGGGAPGSFVARGPNYHFRISPAQVDFFLRSPQVLAGPASVHRREAYPAAGSPARLVRMSFVGGNDRAALSGTGEMDGKVNYLLGNDPAAWRSQVSIFAGVRVSGLYPGIDLTYYGNNRQMEYDFAIAPKADVSVIALHFEGIEKLAVDSNGELVIGLADGELRQHRPVIYQFVQGARREISGGYILKGLRTAALALGAYDHDLPLVIDPVFSYATYFGGNAGDTGLGIKVDSTGAVYLAGETLSTKFPPASNGNSFQGQQHGGTTTGDAFVAKLDSTGSKLIYFTYLGGSGDDGAYDLAINDAGDAFVAGFTESANFPTKNAIFPHISGTLDPNFHIYPQEAFVAELNPDGSGLIYSTYLGGSGNDLASSIAVDPAGYAYVAGYTFSTNFPVVNAYQTKLSGIDDAFVAKLAPDGRSLVYSTYLGGISIDEASGIAVDSSGYAYVAGYTASTNFPVTAGAWSTHLNGSGVAVTVYDAFLTKIPPNGRSLVYSTFLGGSENDFGYRVAVDASGSAYLAGATQSTDFTHTNAFGLRLGNNGTNAVNFDAFLTKFAFNGKPEYSAQFGGTDNDVAWDIALDPAGRAFVVGITLSTNFPVVNPFDLFRRGNSGGKDVFVVAFDTNAAPVLYSGYLGGAGDDYGYAIAVDPEANAYVSGMTYSSAFPTKAGAFQNARSGVNDSFVAKIRLFDPMLNVGLFGGSFQLSWPATAPDYLLQSTADLAPPQVWSDVGQLPVLTGSQYVVNVPATNASTLFRLQRR